MFMFIKLMVVDNNRKGSFYNRGGGGDVGVKSEEGNCGVLEG